MLHVLLTSRSQRYRTHPWAAAQKRPTCLPCATVSPTVLRQGPYRFYFYAGDRLERAHIHVEGLGGEAKFWLRPVTLADAWAIETARWPPSVGS